MGASGDMLLGALLGLGDPVAAAVTDAVTALGLGVSVTSEVTTRSGLAATRAVVHGAEEPGPARRRLSDVLELLTAARLPDPVRERAAATFTRLAHAEAAVHACPVEEVHFHEVGALDALADVVGGCAGLVALDATVSVSPIALGARAAGDAGATGPATPGHGRLPLPVPAVLALLTGTGLPAYAGPAVGELTTPTGAALLATWATAGPGLPLMRVTAVSHGAGSRDIADHPNVLRLVVGTGFAAQPETPALLECTVDDLDPRLWPAALAAVLEAGALDAWLTPVLMKKGRPGHVLTAVVPRRAVPAVTTALLTQTSTLGVREIPLTHRVELGRRFESVQVGGQAIRVKIATLPSGDVAHATAEWDDVAAAAAALGRPPRLVLAEATALAERWLRR